MLSKFTKLNFPKPNFSKFALAKSPKTSMNMGLSQLGLRPKLLTSIITMAGLSALATVIAVVSFKSATEQFNRFNEDRVPALVKAGTLAVNSNEITISASKLIGAKTEETRVAAFDKLTADVDILTKAVDAKSEGQDNDAQIGKLQSAVGNFQSKLSDLDRLTQDNLAKTEESSLKIEELFKINNKMSFLLSPVLDKAEREIKSGGKSVASGAEDIVDRLIRRDLNGFQGMLALRTEIGTMAGAIGSYLMTNDPANEKLFKENMDRASAQILVELENLKKGRAIGDELHAELTAISNYSADAAKLKNRVGYFRDGSAVSNILQEMVGAQAKIDQQLKAEIDKKLSDMSQRAKDGAQDNREQIENLLNVTVIEQRNALETISTIRQYTALIVQGALNNNQEAIASMRRPTEIMFGRFERLASSYKNKNIDNMVATVGTLTTGQEGLIEQRIEQLKINDEIAETVSAVQKDTSDINTVIREMLDNEQGSIAASSSELTEQLVRSSWFLILLGLASIIACVVIGFFIVHLGILKPLSQLIHSTHTLAKGDLESEIGHTKRGDELGQLANALVVFRDNALEKIRMEDEAEAVQRNVEKERKENEEAKAAEADQIQFAVDKLGTGLKQVAEGDLTVRLDEAFVGNLDTLRTDFNQSLEKLEQALSRVAFNTKDISGNSHELREAANLLSSRTESQAASIEETANALGRITEQVASSSQKASEASDIVQVTNSSAIEAAKVVQNAIEAMVRIEDTSGKISQIIALIDEIAFQTNLLALNAGVEAARAGEAGRGFAVVAQEVRELAGRTAEAAKEIKGLISTSVDQVENGVKLVKGTGDSINEIEEKVNMMNEHMLSIADASREQSQDLAEVNQSIRQLDDMTQQNAAMAEETNAATQALADLAGELTNLLAVFAINLEQQAHEASEQKMAKAS